MGVWGMCFVDYMYMACFFCGINRRVVSVHCNLSLENHRLYLVLQ